MKKPSNAQHDVSGYQALPGGKLVGLLSTKRVADPSAKGAPALGPVAGMAGLLAKIW